MLTYDMAPAPAYAAPCRTERVGGNVGQPVRCCTGLNSSSSLVYQLHNDAWVPFAGNVDRDEGEAPWRGFAEVLKIKFPWQKKQDKELTRK